MKILKCVPPNRKVYHFKIFEFSPKMSSKTSKRFESNAVKKLHFQKHCKTLRSVTDKENSKKISSVIKGISSQRNGQMPRRRTTQMKQHLSAVESREGMPQTF